MSHIVLCIVALSVSLTHFPRGISRRKEEASLIRKQNFRPENIDIYRRKSPKHHLRNGRHPKRREARFRNFHSPSRCINRRDWLIKSKFSSHPAELEGFDERSNPYEQCSKSCASEDLTPGTYMVQVEPESEDDCESEDGTCTIERRQSTTSKCYYLFQRKPYKVKFLNYVPSPSEAYAPPIEEVTNPVPDEVSMKLNMPPFHCTPPECREVVYCKYFQCTSLGFFPDPRNCNKYFFCDLNSKGLVLYHMLCPKDRIFDPVIRECRLREIMDKRDVQKCQVEAAKLRRSEKMRIKKNDHEDLIKYKKHSKTDVPYWKPRSVVGYAPNGRWKRRRCYRISGDESESRKNATEQNLRGRNMMHQPGRHFPKCRRKTWETNETLYPFVNFSKPHPISYYEKFFSTTPTLTTTRNGSVLTSTTEITSTSTTVQTTSSELPTTFATLKTTLPEGPILIKKNKTRQLSKKQQYDLGDLDSDAYQDDMQDYAYGSYYDGDYAPEKSLEGDYEWLKQGLTEYLDKLKLKKESKTDRNKNRIKPDTSPEQSSPAQQNDLNSIKNQQEKEQSTLRDQQSDMPPLNDSDGGTRFREKPSSSTAVDQQTESSVVPLNLPDFEQSYKEEKSRNLDGYPCKEYARYPDKFDSVCYYECGVQPDGNMKVEHKCCPNGEEFSPHYLECVATEYLKMTHRKRSALKQSKTNKKPIPDPEDNYEDDKDAPNEWLDASHTNKVPNEFKSKSKNTLRIFHLQCRRNSTEPEDEGQFEDDLSEKRKHEARSFTVRANKKVVVDEPEKTEEDENDDYEDEEEEYEDEPDKETVTTTVEIRSSSQKTTPVESPSTANAPEASTTSKVLLDADIHVGRELENALRNILAKSSEQEKNQKRNSKDSILIRLSENKPYGRTKRNFLKGIFSKKSKNVGDYADKEGVVSMTTLINGLPSEYDRELLLQQLERRKMMNSHLYRVRQGKRKRQKSEADDENIYRNEMMREFPQES